MRQRGKAWPFGQCIHSHTLIAVRHIPPSCGFFSQFDAPFSRWYDSLNPAHKDMDYIKNLYTTSTFFFHRSLVFLFSWAFYTKLFDLQGYAISHFIVDDQGYAILPSPSVFPTEYLPSNHLQTVSTPDLMFQRSRFLFMLSDISTISPASTLLSISNKRDWFCEMWFYCNRLYLFYFFRLGDIRGRPSSLSGYDFPNPGIFLSLPVITLPHRHICSPILPCSSNCVILNRIELFAPG